MDFEHFISGQFIDLERFTNDRMSELESMAMDKKIWQNLPYKIKGKASFGVFVKELQARDLNNQQVTSKMSQEVLICK